MRSRTMRTARRRGAVLALTAALIAGATTVAPTSTASPSDPTDRGTSATDAVVPDAAAIALARRNANPTPTDAFRSDALRRGDAGNIVDIAFVYPAALVTQSDIGGIAGLRAKFAAQVADANTAFTNSGIPVQLRYVGDRQVAAPTSRDLFTMLKQLGTPSDGVYDEAQALREETHADLVSLWPSGAVPVGGSCGVGNIGGISPETEAETAAWTVVFYTDCADKYRVFAHEVGHNFSGDHDAGAASAPLPQSKPYARGFTDPAHGFISVMAYYDACLAVSVNCTRAPYFSGPNVRTPEGYATGNANADNVRAITEQAPAVANYRQSQIYGAVPTITGQPNRGRSLKANTPGWAPGNLTFTYQWAADGAPIADATGASLTLGKAEVGRTITVTATGSGPFYQSVSMTSAPTGAIGKRLFAKAPRPKIKRVGSTVRTVVRGWKPSKKVRYRYTWLRNGKTIKGAKKASYRITRKDRGKKISVKVTARKNGYESTSRTSKKLRIR